MGAVMGEGLYTFLGLRQKALTRRVDGGGFACKGTSEWSCPQVDNC